MSDVSEYEASLRAGQVARPPGALPPHYPSCFGCGPEAEYGLHVVCRIDGDALRTTYTFSEKHSGAPGIAHGGTVAALVDDVCGFSLFLLRRPAVTRKLEVEYLGRVLLDVEYTLRATIAERAGRKIHMAATLEGTTGLLVARSKALFITVDIDHFKYHGQS